VDMTGAGALIVEMVETEGEGDVGVDVPLVLEEETELVGPLVGLTPCAAIIRCLARSANDTPLVCFGCCPRPIIRLISASSSAVVGPSSSSSLSPPFRLLFVTDTDFCGEDGGLVVVDIVLVVNVGVTGLFSMVGDVGVVEAGTVNVLEDIADGEGVVDKGGRDIEGGMEDFKAGEDEGDELTGDPLDGEWFVGVAKAVGEGVEGREEPLSSDIEPKPSVVLDA